MTALYNEIDLYAAKWIENLVAAGHVAPGRVDARSIKEIAAADLAGVVQFHTFAGIAVWSHALRRAGWPDEFPVWTGSCPCQPFSDAGAGAGFADERHLWPDWFKLIDAHRPPVVFGEQVASKDGLARMTTTSAAWEWDAKLPVLERGRIVECPDCKGKRRESIHPHAPRWVVRDGKKLQVDCAGRKVTR